MAAPMFITSTGSDEASVINALKLAFVADPATRWVWQDPERYLSFPHYRELVYKHILLSSCCNK